MREDNEGPGELVRSGHALVRQEDSSMIAMAIQRPRDLKNVEEKTIAEIKTFAEEADTYFYSIPHKTQRCQPKDHDTRHPCQFCEWVMGPSINAALAIQRYWGNCSSEWEITSESDTHVYVKGIFLDYESASRQGKTVRVSKIKKKWGGGTYELSEENLDKAVNAGGSKAQRNAILAGIPDPLKKRILREAILAAETDKPTFLLTKEEAEKIVDGFARYDVDQDQMERKLGKPVNQWTRKDRVRLKSMFNALAAGEVAANIFGVKVQKTKGKPAQGTPADPGKTGTAKTTAKDAPPPARGSGQAQGGKTDPPSKVKSQKGAEPPARDPEEQDAGDPEGDPEEPPPGEAYGDGDEGTEDGDGDEREPGADDDKGPQKGPAPDSSLFD